MTTTVPNAHPAEEAALRSVGSGPVDPAAPTALRPLPFTATRLGDGFLARLQADNSATSIRHGHDHLEEQRAWDNFERAAARAVGEHHGPVFEDGEAFKWLESVAWEDGRDTAADLEGWLDDYSALAAAAQDDDGYLSTFNQSAGQRGRYEWISYDHEIFNMATMIQAAVAQYRTTGRTVLLQVARRAADHLDATFGWGKREELCGHPLIEMALVELYRVTGERRYLDLASFFVEHRGHGTLTDPTWQGWTSVYFSDRIPVRETLYPEGHAVRAVYFASGATDVAIETGDRELLSALVQQWDNMVDAKMYVNGSLGARWEGEAFGDPYELPTDRGYGETCAAIASVQWSWRLLLATGEAKYADLMERQLYNAVLSGVSLGGDEYFYVNTLQVREGAVAYDDRMGASGRHPWFGCSCCPTNLMRTVATVHQYVATSDHRGVQLHLYAPAEVEAEGRRLRIETGYPWDGDIAVTVEDAGVGEWELAVRVPAWAEGATLELIPATASHDAAEAGGRLVAPGDYVRLTRAWAAGDRVLLRLPMAPRAVRGHHRVDAVRGQVAIERGPIVYAFEQVDQEPSARVDDAALVDTDFRIERRPDLFDGVPLVIANGTVMPGGDGRVIDLVAIPYFMWANRRLGAMRVWIPLTAQGSGAEDAARAAS